MRERFLLRDGVIYLNHGSFGACPRAVFEVYQRWQRELEAEPAEFMRRRKDLLRDARSVLADFVGADPDDLVFVPNATTGLNAVARSLPLVPGDEVLTTDQEYGALDRTWRFVCERRGATLVRTPITVPVATHEQIVEAVWAKVTSRTRVLFLSHITAGTALILPIEELIRRARTGGILTVIDGAHAPGQIPVDLNVIGADFYAGNCHKWMCAPKGAAFLHARREVQPLLQPLVVSWGWQAENPGPSRFLDEHEWQGTRDPAAALSVPAAIEFLTAHNWDAVRRACRDLLRTARSAIVAGMSLPPLCPDDATWFVQMASVQLPPCDAEALSRRLFDDYHIEASVWNLNGTQLLRLSIQGYNTQADVDTLIAALPVALRKVAGRSQSAGAPSA